MNNYTTEKMWTVCIIGCAIMILTCVIGLILAHRITKRNREAMEAAIRGLKTMGEEMSAPEFLALRGFRLGKGKSAGTLADFTGVYVLHNQTKDKYYVGQSARVLQRVAAHLTGSGNGDVYADYKYGDMFTVRTIPLVGSGYDSIDALERDAIAAYSAYENGYNKTRGNRAGQGITRI